MAREGQRGGRGGTSGAGWGDREGGGRGDTHQSENLRSGTSLGAHRLCDAFFILVLLCARDLVLLKGREEVRHRSRMATLERALERSGVPMEDGTAPLRAVRTSGSASWKQLDL